MKDPDRGFVCRAIWMFSDLIGEDDFKSVAEAQALVDSLPGPAVVVKSTQSHSCAKWDREPPEIWLSTWRFKPTTLIHEFTHVILPGEGHGPGFVNCLAGLLQEHYGHESYATKLNGCVEASRALEEVVAVGH